MGNEKKPKVAMIGLKGLPAFGGAATVGENIIDQLKDEYEFTVYSVSSHTERDTGEYIGTKQIVFNSLPVVGLNTFWYYVKSTIHALLFGDYDLVHLHHRDAAFIVPFLKLRYKVLITTHQFHDVVDKWKKIRFYFELQERFFVKYANEVSCVSLNEKRIIRKKIGLDAHYIPNGVNIRTKIREPEEVDRGYLMFAAGRIIPIKGLHTLLKALNEVDFGGKVFVAGDIQQVPDYKRKVMQISDDLDVNYLGLIKSKKKLFGYLKGARFFIFPSEMEAMSTMLLEAASVKVPIICSNIVENKDIFNDEEVLFFDVGDACDLSEKIEWARKNQEEMIEKAERAYTKLKENYTWEEISEKYSSLYKSLLKQ